MRFSDPIPVKRLVEARQLRPLDLQVVAGQRGLEERVIVNPRVQKPGLALAGFVESVRPERAQLLGASEMAYLDTLDRAIRNERFLTLVDSEVPVLIFSKGLLPAKDLLDRCNDTGVPVLSTQSLTSETEERMSDFLEEVLAPWEQRHGVLLNVFSVGTLITGDAGVGKSECALELIQRGHRLVADDLVHIRRIRQTSLLGRPHPRLKHVLELRGVGIIDIRSHFGMTATSLETHVSLAVHLVRLDESSLQEEHRRRQAGFGSARPPQVETILGVGIPAFRMVVAPGRDVATMVETAVRKCLLSDRGVHDEQEFIRRVNRTAAGSDWGDESG